MEAQILINRDLFSRLIERYLLTEIQILRLQNSAPETSIERALSVAEDQRKIDVLRGRFEQCDDPADYGDWFLRLDSLLRSREER